VNRSRLLWTMAAVAVTTLALWWMLDARVIAELVRAARNARGWSLLFALLFVPLIQLVRAMRFDLMLSGRVRWPSYELYRIGCLLLFFNYALPFRAGELSFPILAKRRLGIDASSSTGVLMFTRVLDLAAVATFAAAAGAVALKDGLGPFSRGALAAAALAGLLCMMLLPVTGRFAHSGVVRALKRFPRVERPISKLFDGVHNVRTPRQQLGSLLLTLTVWGLQVVMSYAASNAVADLALPQVVFAQSVSSLAFALPINGIAGVGPTQAAWALALERTGETFELGVTTALIWQAVPLVGILLLAALVAATPKRSPLRPAGSPPGDLPPPDAAT